MTYQELMQQLQAARSNPANLSRTINEGSGDGAWQRTETIDPASLYDWNNGLAGNAGVSYRYDPATDSFYVTQGDATSGFQRFLVNQGGVQDLGFEDYDRKGKWNQGAGTLAAIAALGTAGAYAAGLTGAAGASAGAGAGSGIAGGAELAGAYGAGSGTVPLSSLATGSSMSPEIGAAIAGAGEAGMVPVASAGAPYSLAPAAGAGGAAASGASAAGTLWGLDRTTAAILGTTGIGALAANRAAGVQADAARNAADSTLTATRETNQLLRDTLAQQRADNAPWRDAGVTALSSLTRGTQPGGEFDQRFDASRMFDDPGYQFRLSEGQRALEGSAAARGGLLSGGTGRALSRYGQDYASNEYGAAYGRFTNDQSNRFGRLSSLAGLGQTATSANNAAAGNTASQIGANTIGGARTAGDLMTGAAGARASGYVGATNALTGGVGQMVNYGQSGRLMDLLEEEQRQRRLGRW